MVADGYKQTDIGVIPDGWVAESIGNVCQINGRIGFRGYTVKDIVSSDKGAITISPSNIKNNRTTFDKCTYLSWYKYEESPEIKIFNGDILLVKTGSTVGKTALVKDLMEKATLNPQIVVLKKININNIYLSYVASDKLFQNQIQKTVVGGAIPTLSQKQVAEFLFPMPPKPEQQAISTALSDTDELINSLEKLISKKEAIKTGTMQELLTGKKRLDGFSGEWEEKTLDSIAEIATGSTPPTSDRKNYGIDYFFVGPVDLGKTKWILETEKKLSNKGFSKARRFPQNSILYTCIGSTIGKLGISTKELTSNQQINAIFPNQSYSTQFLYYYLASITPYIRGLASEQAVPMINKSSFGEVIVMLPELSEQQVIASILSDMDRDIDALKTKLSKVKAMKEGMMQELLTGRTRLV